MGIAIGVVAVVAMIVFLVWLIRHPSPETTMGMQNRARREAKKAESRDAGGRFED